MSQCSALHDSGKEILSGRDLGNFISWWWYGRTYALGALLVRQNCACLKEVSPIPTFPALPPPLGCGLTGHEWGMIGEDIIR